MGPIPIQGRWGQNLPQEARWRPPENCARKPRPGNETHFQSPRTEPLPALGSGSDMLANTLQYSQECTARGFLIHKSHSLVTFLLSLSFLANRSLENSHYSPEMTIINKYVCPSNGHPHTDRIQTAAFVTAPKRRSTHLKYLKELEDTEMLISDMELSQIFKLSAFKSKWFIKAIKS